MLFIQKVLQSGVGLKYLETTYAISAKRHGSHPNLVLLKYNQIESPFGDPLVKECRGIILDEADNWRVVAHSFGKFFNYGEMHAAPIDWKTARVQEKLDGSILRLYWYKGNWYVSTSGVPDANTPLPAMGEIFGHPITTFKELFWTLYDSYIKSGKVPVLSSLDKNFTYTFEGCAHVNRVVVQHKEPSLSLIGVRDMRTLEELPVESFSRQFPVVKSYPLRSLEDVLSACREMDPVKQEGFVVVDGEFHRIKVKSPAYVALHHLKDGFGARRILEIVRSGENSEFLAHFPEWTKEFNETKKAYDDIIEEIATLYKQATKEVEDLGKQVALTPQRAQKEFAFRVVKNRASGILFTLRKDGIDVENPKPAIRSNLVELNIRSLMSILKLKDFEATE